MESPSLHVPVVIYPQNVEPVVRRTSRFVVGYPEKSLGGTSPLVDPRSSRVIRRGPPPPLLSSPLTSASHAPQAHNKIPDDAWEYQIRKSLNDAAYNGLDYVPYCSTMPVQDNAEDGVKFMWKKKGAK